MKWSRIREIIFIVLAWLFALAIFFLMILKARIFFNF